MQIWWPALKFYSKNCWNFKKSSKNNNEICNMEVDHPEHTEELNAENLSKILHFILLQLNNILLRYLSNLGI